MGTYLNPGNYGFAEILKSENFIRPTLKLKWNKSAEGAIAQIQDRKYPDVLKDYGSDIMLVGINYDKNAAPGQRKHTCRIIRYTKNS